MANADLDKQPDSVSSVLKVFGILQALGEEREIGITELSQRVLMSKSTVYRFLQTMKTLGYVAVSYTHLDVYKRQVWSFARCLA